MAERQEWEYATAHSRRLAIAADAELRRRHPGATVESLLQSEGGLTLSTTARDAWIARTGDAVRLMISEHRVADSDVAAAKAVAQQVLRFAASRAREQGRHEIIEADIDAATLRIRIWPFS